MEGKCGADSSDVYSIEFYRLSHGTAKPEMVSSLDSTILVLTNRLNPRQARSCRLERWFSNQIGYSIC